MSTIRLDVSSWLNNAGLVGFINILEAADKHVTPKQNYVEFDSSVLENFADDYFNYFATKYSDHLSYTAIIKKGNNLLEIKEWNESLLELFNKDIEFIKKQLTSNSYKAAYEMMPLEPDDILNLEKDLAKIKLKVNQNVVDIQENIERVLHSLQNILTIIQHPDIKKYILAKNIIYTIIDKFWGNVSFLNSQAKNNDVYHEYESYFIDPVHDYYSADHKKDKYCCLTCSRPIKKLGKPASYDLAWLNKMGVDIKRKTSHFWNLNASTNYICPICNLIFSCIPAGFSVIKGQGYFVNSNSNVKKMIKLNNNGEEIAIRENDTIQLMELRSYYQLLDYMEQQKIKKTTSEIDNIQIIKFSSKTKTDQQRPYTFNVLSKDKLQIIQRNSKALNELVNKFIKLNDDLYMNVYQSVVERLYQNRNQFDLIGLLCRNAMPTKGEVSLQNIKVIRQILYFNNDFLWTINRRENDSMNGYTSYVKRETIKEIEKAGKILSLTYAKKNATNKLSGITYRLLNALKTKDTGKFMDTFVNAHLFGGKEIPKEIIEVLQDENKLQTLGYAFLIGLRSSISESELEGGKENE
ncbi:MAG: type I-B CRISPR-associated protein Cas8b1/Cst1 [Bacillaceae bacterium]